MAYVSVRNTLLLATLISLVIFALYPAAPPRVAGIGISDPVSGGQFNLNHGLVSSLYNPFAAMPSMHFGYALIVGVSLICEAHADGLRLTGLLYPALVLLIIITTGNHFLLDAVAGAAVVGAAALIVRAVAPVSRSNERARRWSRTEF
jgi:membrane-associated phospholipid phosphatase